MKFYLFILVNLFLLTALAQDVLLEQKLTLTTRDIDLVMEKTESDIKLFVENFEVRLDSGSKITSKKVVLGSQLQPILKVSVKKCVFIVCQTIDLDVEFILNRTNKACDFSYDLSGDLARSSQTLTDVYSNLNTTICIKRTATGATAALRVYLLRSNNYSNGLVQGEILKFIKLQANGVVESFSKVLQAHGVVESFSKVLQAHGVGVSN